MRMTGRLIKDEPTMAALLAIVLAGLALWSLGCGGGGGGAYASAAPTAPSSTTATSAAPSGAVTVTIVGSAGNTAFNPNPVQAAAGATIAWKNNTGDVHHIVMDDGTVVGDVAPGATVAMPLKGTGGNYHCTTHPTMVGSVNGATAPPDPMPNPSGGYDY